MEVRIQPIHFEIAQRLVDHINKKAQRLERHFPNVTVLDVTLKVVKPESAMNKQAIIRIFKPQEHETVADKTADSFEEAVDVALAAAEHQLEMVKNRK